MDGSDQDWSPITSENKTTYSNLKPGRYQFNVRACNNDGIWNEKAVMFNFRIKPPFWETWWFYSSELLLFLSLLSVSFIIGHSSSSHKKYKTVLIFISIFVVFEFTKTLLEPYFDNIGGGIPIFKVFMNLILAIILLPLEKIFSKYLGEKK
ncbi:MAG: hypothetical protein A3H98_13845 [Bacteroidetes bacterium RIFCSPLOWO2_02_FULL_36_8]|nr:MAG: hypothetical protein A3H98_13845 [Bacteroidetes bacterium RIFCSPLOWO2_02_FULL_36_8]